MRKVKPNRLTIETRQDWAKADRDQKNGRFEPGRGLRRTYEWAAWRLANDGVVVPDGATAQLYGNRIEYRLEIAGETKKVGRSTWRHTAPRFEVVAVVEIPAHCFPVADADKWMTSYCQQMESKCS